MKKNAGADDASESTVPTEAPDAGAVASDTPAEVDHEVPAAGGSYVRQKDGTLKRED